MIDEIDWQIEDEDSAPAPRTAADTARSALQPRKHPRPRSSKMRMRLRRMMVQVMMPRDGSGRRMNGLSGASSRGGTPMGWMAKLARWGMIGTLGPRTGSRISPTAGNSTELEDCFESLSPTPGN